jgi:hypothetical protein
MSEKEKCLASRKFLPDPLSLAELSFLLYSKRPWSALPYRMEWRYSCALHGAGGQGSVTIG